MTKLKKHSKDTYDVIFDRLKVIEDNFSEIFYDLREHDIDSTDCQTVLVELFNHIAHCTDELYEQLRK